MIRLLKGVSWIVRWVVHTPRRVIGVLAVPVLIVVALAAGPIRDRGHDNDPGGVLADGATAAPPASRGPRETGLPGTTGPPVSAPTRTVPAIPAAERTAAVAYVTTANTHDARPGADKTFTDSYRRTKPYVTPELYAIVSADSRRGDYEWTQWVTQRATVRVEITAVGVPDGAPVPTASTAYVRVRFRQVVTPTVAGGTEHATDGAVNLLLTRTGDRWLVSRLLADT